MTLLESVRSSRELRAIQVSQKLLWLYVLAIAIPGPLDIVLTGIAWHLESNPIVLLIGPEKWLIAKVLVVVVASVVFLDAQYENPVEYPVLAAAWLGVLVGLGSRLVRIAVFPQSQACDGFLPVTSAGFRGRG